MKYWQRALSLFLLVHPIDLIPDEAADFDDLEEFDDDDFLAAKTEKTIVANNLGWSLFRSDGNEDKYVINFNNVSIVEYLRFVSKISNVNFQFEPVDLDFTVTVMSEEPLTVQNILSALIQTLRARGFSLLEQDNNLLITKSTAINQIPTIVSAEKGMKGGEKAPIVTRVFRIQNASLNSLASIIRPMMSQGAMIDVSNETRQLIVTDITTNVDKIADLLKSLDSPHSPLEIETYKARHMSADELIKMAKQIVDPFADGNPLIMVPQAETNTIFVVSTPSLIERSIEVMEDLDARPKETKGPVGDRVFLYKITNKSSAELLEALEEIAEELQGTGSQSVKLTAALENAKWIKDSNSLMFITDGETQAKLEAILKTLDTFSDTRSYYIYKLQNAGKEQIQSSLQQLAKTLKKTTSDRDLVDTINSLRFIKETNSLIFTGSEESLKKLQELLASFDVAVAQYAPSSHFWLYTPQFLDGKELEKALSDLERSLSSAGLSDETLISAIKSMKWVPSTNTLLFTGTPPALEHVQSMLKLIDVPTSAPTKIFLYKPKYISNQQIEEALDELADKLDHKNLNDRNLALAIDNMTWIGESQTFLFKADPGSIDKINAFLSEVDNAKEAETIAQSYYLYKLKFARGDEVIAHLEKIAKSLPEKNPAQKSIIDVIDKATFLKDTNAVLITGAQKSVEEVKQLIEQFDAPGSTPPLFEKTSFFIYKPAHVSPTSLELALKETADDLKKSGLIDPGLLQSIETMRVVEMTNSVIFTGTKESLEKTKEIITTVDVAGLAPHPNLGEFAGSSFFIYKVRYVTIQELLRTVNSVMKNLEKDEGNKALIKALRTAKEIKETNSLLFTGPNPVLEKIAELMKQLDTPGGIGEGEMAKEMARAPGSYVVYKPVNVTGAELIEMMKDFAQNLSDSGLQEQGLFETIENLKYIDRTGFILISGNQESVEKVQELLRKFDTPGFGGVTVLPQSETSFLIYKLQFHPGEEIQKSLKQIGQDLGQSDPNANKNILSAINSIQWIKITNSLLATGTPEVLTQLKELIQNVDVPLRQVFIEVLIVRTTLTNNQQFGLQWGGKVQYLNRFAGGVSNFPTPPSTGVTNAFLAPGLAAVNATRTPLATDIPNPTSTTGSGFPGGFDLGVIGDIILHRGKTFLSLASLVNALQSDEESIIVMNPKIIAQDNQQSTLFVGQNIPFTGSNVTTVGGGASSQVQSNIEYRDVGTSLMITPILGANDIVTLDIQNEITRQVENSTANGASLQGLQTTRTAINARVHVPNKHFVALSGMITDEKTRFRTGIPCLGGLPVIGALFAENDRLNARDNLIFFIRPVIVDSIEEYQRITQNQECLLKERSSKQILKEEIDEGLDWVENPFFD